MEAKTCAMAFSNYKAAGDPLGQELRTSDPASGHPAISKAVMGRMCPPTSSYAESLNLSTPDCEVLGNRVFKEVIEFKRGH